MSGRNCGRLRILRSGVCRRRLLSAADTRTREARGVRRSATPRTHASLFYPFRALGYVNEGVPFVEHRRGTEHFVTVSAGKAFRFTTASVFGWCWWGRRAIDITALAVKGT